LTSLWHARSKRPSNRPLFSAKFPICVP
jgi:hypothetical protein